MVLCVLSQGAPLGEEGSGYGHQLSLITNIMANSSVVEAAALQPCDL